MVQCLKNYLEGDTGILNALDLRVWAWHTNEQSLGPTCADIPRTCSESEAVGNLQQSVICINLLQEEG